MNRSQHKKKLSFRPAFIAAIALTSTPFLPAQQPQFTPGNLVVVVEGCGIYAGTCTAIPNGSGTGAGNSSSTGYGDNQAAPLTLFQFAPIGTTSATYVNSLVLPLTAKGANFPVIGEYGSTSEGTMHLSGSGQYLTVMGYGINPATFNANPTQYGAAPSLALAQSGSLTGQTYTPIARVLALIDNNGNVNSTTALYNIFNLNNPRSNYTLNGTTAYVSGQGSGTDATGGVFFTPIGAVNNTPTPITGLDATNNTIAQDTRDVQIVNNTLYLSVDTKAGSGAARDYIGTLGTAGTPPTTTVGPPVMLNGYGTTAQNGKVTITTGANSNGNGQNVGQQINVSPFNYFFANPSTLYVADGGNPKNNSATSATGDGGLQKWLNSAPDGSGTWSLAYTLATGLSLVSNKAGTGVSGLYGLAASVSGNTVQLFATSSTLSDLDTTYLYGITDTLTYTTASQAAAETFATLATAPSDSNFKGVSFTPTVVTPVAPANITVARTLSRSSGNVTAQLTISNNGGTTALNVMLTSAKIGSLTATPLPQSLGTIPAGGSVQATVSVPASVGSTGAASTLNVSGTFTGNAFNSTSRITLP